MTNAVINVTFRAGNNQLKQRTHRVRMGVFLSGCAELVMDRLMSMAARRGWLTAYGTFRPSSVTISVFGNTRTVEYK